MLNWDDPLAAPTPRAPEPVAEIPMADSTAVESVECHRSTGPCQQWFGD